MLNAVVRFDNERIWYNVDQIEKRQLTLTDRTGKHNFSYLLKALSNVK